MSTSVRHPNRQRDGMRAAIAALIRWYPGTSIGLFERVREMKPGYPLINGGSPRVPAINAEVRA